MCAVPRDHRPDPDGTLSVAAAAASTLAVMAIVVAATLTAAATLFELKTSGKKPSLAISSLSIRDNEPLSLTLITPELRLVRQECAVSLRV